MGGEGVGEFKVAGVSAGDVSAGVCGGEVGARGRVVGGGLGVCLQLWLLGQGHCMVWLDLPAASFWVYWACNI